MAIAWTYAALGTCGLAAGLWLVRHEFYRALQPLVPKPRYGGRHRAAGPSTVELSLKAHREQLAIVAVQRRRAEIEAARLLDGLDDRDHDAPELDRPGRGVKAYGQLRTEALDTSTAERFYELVGRSVWGTPSTVDEWDPMPVGVDGYAIAGRTR